jgi:hypothetical protein
MTIWSNDRRQRKSLNEHWLQMIPDPEHRPARLTLNRHLDSGKLDGREIIAVLQNKQP